MNKNLYKTMLSDKEFKAKSERPYVHILKHNGKLYSIPLLSNKSSGYPNLSMAVKSKDDDEIGYLDFSKSFQILNDNFFIKSSITIEVDENESKKYFEMLYETRKKSTSKMVNQTKALNIQRNFYLKEYLKKNNLPLNKKFICRSKEHDDKEASMQYNQKNNTLHCFSCGVTFDLISLIQNDFEVSYNQSLVIIDNLIKSDFKDSIIDYDYSTNNKVVNKVSKEALEQKLDYIQKCKSNVDKTNYFSNRGISKEIYSKIAGYDNENNRVIFLTMYPNTSYIYKNLNTKQKGYFILKEDKINISYDLNISDSKKVFITEGIFDGMSFGTMHQNYISLNSANNINNFKELIKELENIYDFEYILAMDNDQAGINATNKIIDFFKENAIKYSLFSMHDYNDPNEFYCNDKNKFINELNYHEKLTSLIEREETTMENEKKLDNQSNDEKENIENTYFYKVKKIVDNFSISEEDELKKTRKLKQELSSILDEMKNDKELKTQKEIDQETERILSGTVINVADFNVKDKDNLVSRNFWIESEKGKKYNCQMFVNPNYESRNIKKGDVVSLTGNFKKFKDKEGIEKLTFKVSKLENTSAQVQNKEQEQKL